MSSFIRIAIVDDQPGNRIIIRKKLESNTSFKVVLLAENGRDFLDKMKLLPSDQIPDVVLMDLEMPEMDGYTTIRKIRESNSELPVIAFTAALLENMDSFIADNGFNDYILKPYRPSDLKMKMAKYAPHRKVDY